MKTWLNPNLPNDAFLHCPFTYSNFICPSLGFRPFAFQQLYLSCQLCARSRTKWVVTLGISHNFCHPSLCLRTLFAFGQSPITYRKLTARSRLLLGVKGWHLAPNVCAMGTCFWQSVSPYRDFLYLSMHPGKVTYPKFSFLVNFFQIYFFFHFFIFSLICSF